VLPVRWFSQREVFMKCCLRGVVILACFAPACGKAVDRGAGADATDAAPDDDGGDDGDVDDGGDDDGSGDDGDDDGGGSDAGATGEGFILASSTTYTSEGGDLEQSSFARAFFGDYRTESCKVEREEPECRVLSCTPRDPAVPNPEAGVVVIQVASVDAAQMTPGKNGAYNAFGAAAQLFDDGAALTALAPGADVPAFEIPLIAPFSIGFQPDLVPTPDNPISMSASEGHDMTWGGISASDTVHVTLSALPDEDQVSRRIDCTLPAGVARLFLTPDALSLMPLGALDFEARVETTATVTAGDYQVTFTASVVARTGDSPADNAATGTVMLVE
jgi:hypothetical protein